LIGENLEVPLEEETPKQSAGSLNGKLVTKKQKETDGDSEGEIGSDQSDEETTDQ
jgi:hypothetical protein